MSTEMPRQVLTWLREFHTAVATNDVATMVSNLACMDVDDPNRDPYETRDEALAWVYGHRREFNLLIWNIITAVPDLLSRLRTAVQRGVGKMEPHYREALLEHFLVEKPDWC